MCTLLCHTVSDLTKSSLKGVTNNYIYDCSSINTLCCVALQFDFHSCEIHSFDRLTQPLNSNLYNMYCNIIFYYTRLF